MYFSGSVIYFTIKKNESKKKKIITKKSGIFGITLKMRSQDQAP